MRSLWNWRVRLVGMQGALALTVTSAGRRGFAGGGRDGRDAGDRRPGARAGIVPTRNRRRGRPAPSLERDARNATLSSESAGRAKSLNAEVELVRLREENRLLRERLAAMEARHALELHQLLQHGLRLQGGEGYARAEAEFLKALAMIPTMPASTTTSASFTMTIWTSPRKHVNICRVSQAGARRSGRGAGARMAGYAGLSGAAAGPGNARHDHSKRAYPRGGLIGNPSDGYFGKTIAFTFSELPRRGRSVRDPGAGDPAATRATIRGSRACGELVGGRAPVRLLRRHPAAQGGGQAFPRLLPERRASRCTTATSRSATSPTFRTWSGWPGRAPSSRPACAP